MINWIKKVFYKDCEDDVQCKDIRGFYFPYGTIKSYEDYFKNDKEIIAVNFDSLLRVYFTTKRGYKTFLYVELLSSLDFEEVKTEILKREKIDNYN